MSGENIQCRPSEQPLPSHLLLIPVLPVGFISLLCAAQVPSWLYSSFLGPEFPGPEYLSLCHLFLPPLAVNSTSNSSSNPESPACVPGRWMNTEAYPSQQWLWEWQSDELEKWMWQAETSLLRALIHCDVRSSWPSYITAEAALKPSAFGRSEALWTFALRKVVCSDFLVILEKISTILYPNLHKICVGLQKTVNSHNATQHHRLLCYDSRDV